MEDNVLHNITETSFSERETFNNAILLLSMVKSEYYYIIGFSRPDNTIEIGFDFQNRLYGNITETITLDFVSPFNELRIRSELKNLYFGEKTKVTLPADSPFSIFEGTIFYQRTYALDSVIPISMDALNNIILNVKKELSEFLLAGYTELIHVDCQ